MLSIFNFLKPKEEIETYIQEFDLELDDAYYDQATELNLFEPVDLSDKYIILASGEVANFYIPIHFSVKQNGEIKTATPKAFCTETVVKFLDKNGNDAYSTYAGYLLNNVVIHTWNIITEELLVFDDEDTAKRFKRHIEQQVYMQLSSTFEESSVEKAEEFMELSIVKVKDYAPEFANMTNDLSENFNNILKEIEEEEND